MSSRFVCDPSTAKISAPDAVWRTTVLKIIVVFHVGSDAVFPFHGLNFFHIDKSGSPKVIEVEGRVAVSSIIMDTSHLGFERFSCKAEARRVCDNLD